MNNWTQIDQDRFREPDMGEYYDEETQQELLKKIDEIDGKEAAYYVEAPFSLQPGYYEQYACFVVKATPMIDNSVTGKEAIALNYIDGDTVPFYLDTSYIGENSFTIGINTYNTFEEYVYKFSGSDAKSNCFKIRTVGINAPEVPHYAIVSVKDSEVSDRIKEFRLEEFKDKENFKYEVNKTRVRETYKFLKMENKTGEYTKTTWNEIIDTFGHSNPYWSADDTRECGKQESPDVQYYEIISKDEQTEKDMVDGKNTGIEAKNLMIDILKKAEDIRILVDARQLYTGINYSGIYDILRKGIDDDSTIFDVYRRSLLENFGEEIWKYDGFPRTFGQDYYQRFLGAVYVKVTVDQEPIWINVNKYIYEKMNGAVALDLGLTPADIARGNHLSDAFRVWSFDSSKVKYLDAFLDLSKDDLDDRIDTQREIIGCDYNDYLEYTVMIGDCLLMVPPTSIRLINEIESQRVPILRSKNTALLEKPNTNRVLQMTLYFNNESGINGIKIRKQTPSQTGTDEYTYYYMNGLRSLIAEFKFTPFLPIENDYINHTLGIEAVSLISMDIETMPMYPKCLAVNLVLQEFNYRIYLNDLPIPDPDKGEKSDKNMFSASINYGVMRYYYQRAIQSGEEIKDYPVDSDEYIENTIGHNTNLIPMNFKDCGITFLTVNRSWLDKLKQTYLASKKQPINQIEPINEETAKWAYQIGKSIAAILEELNSNIVYDPKSVITDDDKKDDNITVGSYSAFLINYLYDHLIYGDQKKAPYLMEITTQSGKLANTESIYCFRFNMDNITQAEVKNLVKAVCKQLGLDGENSTALELIKENKILINGKLNFKITLDTNNEGKLYYKLDVTTTEYKVGYYFAERSGYIENPDDTEEIDYEDWFDFATASNDENLQIMKDLGIDSETALSKKFNYYPIKDIIADKFSVKMENIMSKTTLKSQPGFAPQYAGGQDTVIEFSFYTQDETTVQMLNMMEDIAVDDLVNYKDVISCWPIRINSELTRLCGINETIIESVDISTVPMQPGLYYVSCRAISVDRTVRSRERLKRLDTDNSGAINPQGISSWVYKTYFDLNKELAKAELYPDLELPSLDDLEKTGYKFIKYMNKVDRRYPDPDFYFVYAYAYSARMLKKTIVDYFKDNGDGSYIGRSIQNLVDDSVADEVEAKLSAEENEVIDYSNHLNPDIYNSYIQAQIDQANSIAKDNSLNTEQKIQEKNKSAFIKKAMSTYQSLNDQLLALYGPIWNVTKDIKVMFPDEYDTDKEVSGKQIVESVGMQVAFINVIISSEIMKPIVCDNSTDKINPSKSELQSIIRKASKTVYNKYNYDNGILCQIKKALNITVSEHGLEPYTNAAKEGTTVRIGPAMIEAAAIASSGGTEYGEKIDWEQYYAKEFIPALKQAEKIYYTPEEDSWVVDTEKTNKNNAQAIYPYCKMSDPNTGESYFANTIDEALKYGKTFGAWQIKIYSAAYLNDFYKFLGYTFTESGFLDPYYNNEIRKAMGKEAISKDEIQQYKKDCMLSAKFCAEAFMRIVMVWIWRLTEEGHYVTYYDCNRKNFANVLDELVAAEKKFENEYAEGYTKNEIEQDYVKESLEPIEAMVKDMKSSLNDLVDVYEYSIANGKLFLPIMCAVTDGDDKYYDEVSSHNIDVLYNDTRACQSQKQVSVEASEGERNFRKLIKAMLITSPKIIKDESGIAGSSLTKLDEAIQERNEKLWCNACQDPQLWVLHSFYDMIVNDKRGRMARAFPTYYVLLIEEGREFGYWKLHDNFYNMSSISEFEVVKSRKMPADTARIVMTNMYKTFSLDDEDLREEYNTTLLDAWRSIFSPHIFFEQEELKRKNRMNIDRATMKPGVRLSLRMGYGGDASSLPIMFNGVVAEVSTGQVLEIVAQSDGHELANNQAFAGVTAEDAADLANESSALKWVTNFFTEGATPKTLMRNILTTKSGFIGKLVNKFTSGRFFNDNKFGVTHFGEIDYKEIHKNGEVMQNIYESEGRMPWNNNACDVCATAYQFQSENPPEFTVELNGKSVWDIINICASAGVEFMAGIAPFGLRSTIFIGRPHYYYAYDYDISDNGLILEKRKPFQQYHLIDSYSDIIYNNIHTNAKDVKTVAVPIYRGPGMLGNIVEKKCEPLYADWDIYPEFQKTMVVNTGMTYKRSKTGLLVINKYIDEWSMNGGQKIAWRMGARALKDAFKDMYDGDICIIGDPSIKPFDKVQLFDIYENMSGTFEVEAVVQTLSPETGFTTDIYPDLISCVDSRYEQLGQAWSLKLFSQIFIAKTSLYTVNRLFLLNTKPVMNGLRKIMLKGAQDIVGFINKAGAYANMDDIIKYSSLEKWASKFNNVFGYTDSSTKLFGLLSKADNYAKVIDDINPKDITNFKQFCAALKNMQNGLSNTDYESLAKNLEKMISDEQIKADKVDDINDFIKELRKNSNGELTAAKNNFINATSNYVDDFYNALNKIGADKMTDAQKEALKVIEAYKNKSSVSIDDTKAVLDSIDDISDTVGDFKDIDKSLKSLTLAQKSASGVMNGVSKLMTKFGVQDASTIAKVATTAGVVTRVVWSLGKMAILYILQKNLYNYIENKMASFNVLTVFPLKKNNSVMVAGIDGHKGLVVGSPSWEEKGPIDSFIEWVFKDRGPAYDILVKGILFSSNMNEIAESYKTENKLGISEIANESDISNLLANIAESQATTSSNYKALKYAVRLTSTNDMEASDTFRYSTIKDDISSISANERLQEDFVPICATNSNLAPYMEDKQNIRLVVLHEIASYDDQNTSRISGEKYSKISINFENINSIPTGKVTLLCTVVDENQLDIPMIRADSYQVFYRLLTLLNDKYENEYYDSTKTDKPTLLFTSGTVTNNNKWNSTGYVFKIDSSNIDSSVIFDALSTIQKELNSFKTPVVQFARISGGNGSAFRVFVLPRNKSFQYVYTETEAEEDENEANGETGAND